MDRSQANRNHAATRLRPERSPGAASRLRRLRARRNSRNGCRRGAAASVRRNWRIPHGLHAAAPGDSGASRRATAMSFSLVRPWDCAPLLTTCASRNRQGITKSTFGRKSESRRLPEQPIHRNGSTTVLRASPGPLQRNPATTAALARITRIRRILCDGVSSPLSIVNGETRACLRMRSLTDRR